MWLKSAFISGYSTIAFLLVAAAIYFSGQASALSVLGASLGSGVFLAFLGYLFIVGSARTGASLWPVTIAGLAGFLLALSGVEQSPLHAGLALVGLVGNSLYVYWYSRFGREKNELLEVGKVLPEFELQTDKGENVSSEEFRKQPSLLMFYRGNWCPLCMAQIKEVAAMYRKMEERGIKIYLISPQSHSQTSALADRFDVPMNFLVDKDNKAADRLQIKAEGGLPMGLQALGYDSDTVMPTVVMTGDKGEIIFADLTDNYRVRPEPEDFLRVFDENMAGV